MKRLKIKVTWGGNVKIVPGSYLFEKCFESRKNKTSMILFDVAQ